MATSGTLLGGLDAWLSKPASLLDEWARALRPRRRVELSVSADGAHLLVMPARGGRPAAELPLKGTDDARSDTATRLAEAVAGRRVRVLIPSAWIVERSIDLPLEAASHLAGIVASRLSALSPVPPAEALHGYRVDTSDRGSQKMKVSVAIVPKARLSVLLGLLAAARPREIDLRARLAGGEEITLLSSSSGPAKATGAKAALAMLLILALGAAGATLGAHYWLDAEMAQKRAALERRADTARDTIAAATTPVVADSVPEQIALQLKQEAISVIGALDDLAAAMPLHAHATEISLEGDTMRLAGRTSDLPDLLTALESSGRFADSRLVGTATRAQDGLLSDFVLQTRPLTLTGGLDR